MSLNRKNSSLLFISIASLLFFFTACSTPGPRLDQKVEKVPLPSLSFIALSASTLIQVDLLDLSKTVLYGFYNSSNGVPQANVFTSLPGNKIVYSDYRKEPHSKVPSTHTNHIYELDLNTKAEKYVGVGGDPVFLKKHNTIFFYAYSEKLTEICIYSANYDNIEGTKKLIMSGPFRNHDQIVQINSNEVVLRNTRSGFAKYNVITEELTPIQIDDKCSPKFWRSPDQQMYCFIPTLSGPTKASLVSLNGQQTVLKDLSGAERPIIYIEELDAMLFRVRRLAAFSLSMETSDVWIFYFKTNEKIKLLNDAGSSWAHATRIEE